MIRGSIATRLVVSLLALGAVLLATWALATGATGALRGSYVRTVTTIDGLTTTVLEGSKLRDDEETALRGYLLTGRPEFLQPYTAAQRALPAVQRRAERLVSGAPGASRLWHDWWSAAQNWENWARAVLHRPTAPQRGSAALLAQQRIGKRLFDRYRAVTARLQLSLDQARQADLAASLRMLDRVSLLFSLLFVGALVLGGLLGWRILRAILTPLRRLEEVAERIGRGDLTRPIAAPGIREFKRVGASMEWMRRQLQEREEALRSSEDRFRSLTEHGTDLICILAPNGTARYASPSYTRVLGAPLEELHRQAGSPLAVIHPDDRARVHAALVACVRDGAPGVMLTCRHRHADGSWRTLDAVATNRLDDPAIGGIIVTCRDITARAEAEEALRASEDRYRQVEASAPIGLALVAPDGRWLRVNPALCALVGYAGDELLARTFQDITHPDDLEADLDYVRQMLAGEIATYQMEKRYVRKDGRLVWVLLAVSLLRDGAGQPLYFIAQIQNIDGRKHAEAALERSNAELQQFAYVASHDLQEPLRTVQSYLALLQRRYKGKLGDDADEFIGYATDGARRMSALIKAVLDYSRVGTHGGAFGVADCGALVGEVVANLEARMAESGARVTYDALPIVRGDVAQLAQLFQNLIGNALKFTRPSAPPEVRLGAERQGDCWLIRVADNGIGIAPEHAPRIFQMFGRLHTRTEYEGTGIGLAVCQRIVERHGGRIWVESQPGQGATFLFTLPALDGYAIADVTTDDREDDAA